jgi:hypothetical protein
VNGDRACDYLFGEPVERIRIESMHSLEAGFQPSIKTPKNIESSGAQRKLFNQQTRWSGADSTILTAPVPPVPPVQGLSFSV